MKTKIEQQFIKRHLYNWCRFYSNSANPFKAYVVMFNKLRKMSEQEQEFWIDAGWQLFHDQFAKHELN